MSYWNVRVVRTEQHGEAVFDFREVFYDSSNRIVNWTGEAVAPHGDNLAELTASLEHFARATRERVLSEQVVDGRLLLVEHGLYR